MIKIKTSILKNTVFFVLFLIIPWSNFYNSNELPALKIKDSNIGYYQTNTCTFNLNEFLKENIINTNFELFSDLYSEVECHGKINGVDVVNEKIRVYVGTNLNIDLIIQSLFWIFLISLIPKTEDKYKFKTLIFTISTILFLFYLHLIGESNFYKNFYDNFSYNIFNSNYFLFSIFLSLILISLVLNILLTNRLQNLINYFPFIFLLIGAFNSFNFNFLILIFIFLGVEALVTKNFSSKFSTFYFLYAILIILSSKNLNLFFDVDKLKGFSNSGAMTISKIYWLIIYYLIFLGFIFVVKISKSNVNLLILRKNFIFAGGIISILGYLSSINPVLNYYIYYYLGLNKPGIKSINSIEGNTWRGIGPSAESLGEFYSYIILFVILVSVLKKINISKTEALIIIAILLGLFKTNNVAASISLIFLIFTFVFRYFLNIKVKRKKILAITIFAGVLLILLLLNTNFYDDYSKNLIYHSLNNANINISLPENEIGDNLIDRKSFGEIFIYEEKNLGISNTLYNAIEIFDKNQIKYLPNPIAVISVVSTVINRSEKWGIFLAKYNPSISELFFGYGPNQLSEYYLIHPTKVNTGLVLPHSSLLDILLFFGVTGLIIISKFILNLFKKNKKNLLFSYLLFFIIINYLKSDSILYFSSFLLILFTMMISNINLETNEKEKN